MNDSTCCYISSIQLETVDYVLVVRELGTAKLLKESDERIERREFVAALNERVLIMSLGSNSQSANEGFTTLHG